LEVIIMAEKYKRWLKRWLDKPQAAGKQFFKWERRYKALKVTNAWRRIQRSA
jgi:hypothetical protein